MKIIADTLKIKAVDFQVKHPGSVFYVIFFCLFLIMMAENPVIFAQQIKSHAVTIIVPESLSFSGDTSAFSLEFPDTNKGSETDTKTVNYSIRGNNVSRQVGVIQAQLNGTFKNVRLLANVGSYNKQSGNASLTPSNAGFVEIGDQSVNLCDRKIDSGSGKILRGSIPILYKASASDVLESGQFSQNLVLSICDN